MSWKTLFSRLKTKKQSYQPTHLLDERLIKKTRPFALPKLAQFKYLGHFLSNREKRVITVASAIVLLSTLFSIGAFISRHIIFLPKEGGEYSEALVGQPKYINPLFASTSEVDTDITSLMYAGLLRYDKNQKLVPYLATGYSVNEDKKVYTISLRQDARWSDGERFNADDVVTTFELIQDPEVSSPLYPTFQGIKVEKLDDYTVRFTLKEPFAPFLSSLTVGILPAHIWLPLPRQGLRLSEKNLQPPVSIGPWQFGKLVKDKNSGTAKSYTVTRNEYYFEKKPYLKTLHFQFYNSRDEAFEALRSQEVQAMSFVSQSLKNKLSDKKFTFHTLHIPQYVALFFNEKEQPVLENKEVRLALTQGIDKNTLVATLNYAATSLDAPLLEGMIGYHAEVKKYPFDVDKANALLDKEWSRIEPEEYFKIRQDSLLKEYKAEIEELKKSASSTEGVEIPSEDEAQVAEQIANTVRGEMDPGQSFYRINKNKTPLSLAITTADTSEYTTAAERIAEMWRKIGVQTSVEKVNSLQIEQKTLKNRSYQILLYGEIVGSDPDIFPFWHSSQIDYPGLNLALFVNRKADQLLEEARRTVDEEKRAALYRQLQDLLAEELPAIFLYSPTHNFISDKKLQGVTIDRIDTPESRYNDLENWYVKTAWKWKR